jgi:hypothetical protein
MTTAGKPDPAQSPPPARPNGSGPQPTGRLFAALGSMGRVKWLAVGLLAIAIAIAVMIWPPPQPPPPFEVLIVPSQKKNGDEDHMATPDWGHVLKAVVRAKPGVLLNYEWDLGDGSKAGGSVKDPDHLGIAHKYSGATPGSVFHASLTVTDRERRWSIKKEYNVRFTAANRDNQKTVAVENGLWYLHTTAERTETVTEGETTRWKPSTSKGPLRTKSKGPLGTKPNGWIGLTAASVHAMELLGHDLTGKKREGCYDDPYAEDVRRGLNALVPKLKRCPIRDPGRLGLPTGRDANGLTIDAPDARIVYQETALVLMALASSGAPTTEVLASNEDLMKDGRYTYERCVKELVLYLADVQNEDGGWGFGKGKFSATSLDATLWPVLAFLTAKRAMKNVEPPANTVKRLSDNLGQTRGPLVPKNFDQTAAAAICLSLCKLRAGTAVEEIGKNWPKDKDLDEALMYIVSSAGVFAESRIEFFGRHEWRPKFSELLIERAKHDDEQDHPSRGWYWPGSIRTSNDRTFATASALLTLHHCAATGPD